MVVRALTVVALWLLVGLAGAEEPRRDALGDPLPAGAVQRLGTTRLRSPYGFTALIFSADGQTLYTADREAIRRWEAATGRALGEVPQSQSNDQDRFAHLALSSEGATLAASNGQGLVRLWDTSSWEVLRDWNIAGEWALLSFLPNGSQLITASSEGVQRWDAVKGEKVWEYRWKQKQPRQALALAVSPDGKRLAVGAGQALYLWRLEGNEAPVVIPQAHGREIRAVAFTSNDQLASSGSAKAISREWLHRTRVYGISTAEVFLWDAATGEKQGELGTSSALRYSTLLAVTPDRTRLLVTNHTATRVWDISQRKLLHTLENLRSPIAPGGLAISPDAATAAVASTGGVQLWDVNTGALRLATNDAPRGRTSWGAWSPDGASVAIVSHGSEVTMWSAATGQRQTSFSLGGPEDVWPYHVAFAANGQQVGVTGVLGGLATPSALKVFDVASNTTLAFWTLQPRNAILANEGQAVAWTSDLHYLAQSSSRFGDPFGAPMEIKPADATYAAEVWDAATGQLVARIGQGYAPAQALRFSADGQRLAVLARENVLFWDAKQQLARKALDLNLHLSDLGRWAAFSPKLDLLALNHNRGSVTVVSLGKNQPHRTFPLPPHKGGAVAFSPDGRFLACGLEHRLTDTNEAPIYVWDLKTGSEIHQFRPTEGACTSLAFSPDGRKLLSTLDVGSSLIWDLAPAQNDP